MKISASIEVSNRNHASLSGYMRKRPVYSTLSIGKVSRDGEFKILYCNKSMAMPKMYNIIGNVERIFSKFIKEGKATIRFKHPPEDIIISHDDERTLMSFLTILVKVLNKEPINTTHVIDFQDTKVPSKPKTSWTVETSKEYWEEFPRTLTTLMVSNINLDDIGNKMRPLLQLKVLDLSKNKLSELPEYLGNLPLSELNLSHNQLTYHSNWSWMKRPSIQKTLHKLVLSNNKLTKLPSTLYKFHNLVDLQLASIDIVTMPTWLCTSFPNIRTLNLSYNRLIFAPANIKDVHKMATLEAPQMEHYNHDDDFPLSSVPRVFPSLKSLAAKCVYPFRSKLTNKSCPENLLMYLYNNIGYCKCGQRMYSEDSHPFSGYFKIECMFNLFYNIAAFGFALNEQDPENGNSGVRVLYQECVNRTKHCR